MSLAKAKKKNPVAQAMVAMRNKKLSKERRREIAQIAARARWDMPMSGKKAEKE